MRLFVTGGAGFIGSNYVRWALANSDDEVTVFDALTYAGNLANLREVEGDPRYRFVKGDITDRHAVEESMAGHDLVLHFAAESHVDRSIVSPDEFVHTNCDGTNVVMDVARRMGVERVLHVSTDEVYGSTPQRSFDESSPLRPNSPYAATKAAADLLCRAYRVTYGFPVTIVRGTNAFGPRQYREKAIPTFVLAALEGRPLPVYGDGSNRRQWLHVRDFARGVITVAEQGEPGETYNIGGGYEIANIDLAKEICRLAGAPPSLIQLVPDRPGHDFRYALEWSRLAALGWQPEVAFEEGLAQTVAWFREWLSAGVA